MKSSQSYDASLIALPFIVLWAAFCFLLFGVSIYGLVLAFQASILVGILALIVEPAPLVIGFAYIFWNVNLAEKFLAWVSG